MTTRSRANPREKDARLGPAITFLFAGPAVNVLAISFTVVQTCMNIATVRLILSLVFGVGIGWLMAVLFRADDEAHDQAVTETGVDATVVKVEGLTRSWRMTFCAHWRW